MREEEGKERKRTEEGTKRRGKTLVVKMKGGRGGEGNRGKDGRVQRKGGEGRMRSREWLRDKRGVSGCKCVCVMSGWPQGAVDSLRCSADVLTGFGPFAHLFAPPLHSLQRGQGWGGAGEMGEVEREKWDRREPNWERMGKNGWGKAKGGKSQKEGDEEQRLPYFWIG